MPLTVNTNSFQVGGVSAGSGGLDAAAVQAEIAKTSPYKHLQTVVIDDVAGVVLNAPEIANYSSALIIIDTLDVGSSQQPVYMRFMTEVGGTSGFSSSVYSWSWHGTSLSSRIGGGNVNDNKGELINSNSSYAPSGPAVGGQIFCSGMAVGGRPIAVARLGAGRGSGTTENARGYNSTITVDGRDHLQITGYEIYGPNSNNFVSGRISIYGLNTHD